MCGNEREREKGSETDGERYRKRESNTGVREGVEYQIGIKRTRLNNHHTIEIYIELEMGRLMVVVDYTIMPNYT